MALLDYPGRFSWLFRGLMMTDLTCVHGNWVHLEFGGCWECHQMNRQNDIAKRLGLDDLPVATRKPGEPPREMKLEQALQGIASCATQCVCCEMHRQVALKALGYEVGITTDSIG